jgi:hypothetical protein
MSSLRWASAGHQAGYSRQRSIDRDENFLQLAAFIKV